MTKFLELSLETLERLDKLELIPETAEEVVEDLQENLEGSLKSFYKIMENFLLDDFGELSESDGLKRLGGYSTRMVVKTTNLWGDLKSLKETLEPVVACFSREQLENCRAPELPKSPTELSAIVIRVIERMRELEIVPESAEECFMETETSLTVSLQRFYSAAGDFLEADLEQLSQEDMLKRFHPHIFLMFESVGELSKDFCKLRSGLAQVMHNIPKEAFEDD